MHAIHCNVSVVTASDPKNDGKVIIKISYTEPEPLLAQTLEHKYDKIL